MEHERPKLRRAPGDIDLRKFVKKKLHESPESAPQLADRLSELLGETVSLSRLYSYTASTKISARLPAYFLPALCEALDSDDILLFLARPRLQKRIEFAETVRELRRICDELLAELPAKRSGHSSSKQPTAHRGNGNGTSCAR